MSVSSSSWGLGRAAVCDCGTPWTFLLPFFVSKQKLSMTIMFYFVRNLTANSQDNTIKRNGYSFSGDTSTKWFLSTSEKGLRYIRTEFTPPKTSKRKVQGVSVHVFYAGSEKYHNSPVDIPLFVEMKSLYRVYVV